MNAESLNEWPKRVSVFVHANNKETMYEKGEKIGLTGNALRMFSYACSEVEVILEVKMDGTAKIVEAK